MKPHWLVRATRAIAVAVLLFSLTAGAAVSTPQESIAARRGRPAPAAPAGKQPPLGIGLQPQRGGLAVQMVTPGSLADAAGIKAGDVITQINGRPVPALTVFVTLVQNRAANQPLELRLTRGRSSVTVRIPAVPSGAPRGSVDRAAAAATRRDIRSTRMRAVGASNSSGPVEVIDPFTIPELAARAPADSRINVLKRIFLDPGTGQLVFVGAFDSAYATGPIDYTTLLHDALRSPTPVFSLEPAPGTEAAVTGFVRQMDQQMAANLRSVETGKAWLIGIFDQLLSNPALEVDRRRFLAKGAELFKVKPEEVPALMQAMLGRTEAGSPPWVNFWVKFYQSLGAPQAAGYMWAAAHKSDDPQAFRDSLDWLGLTPVIDDLRSRVQSGNLTTKAGEGLLEVEVWVAIQRHCKIPESRWLAAAERARRTGDIDAFRAFIDDLNANILRERAMEPWLNGLVLSEAFLQVNNRMPQLESVPICRNGLQPDSALARTFLGADWMLKNLTVTPELAARVPGHLTPTQFAFQRETGQGVYDLGNVEARFWLAPESVALRHDSACTVLDFGDARPGVRAEVMVHSGGSAAAERLLRDALADYGREVTRRYDEYARALPELHQLREAAKILALVNWARARGLKLVPPGPAAPPQALPASFRRGFWSAYFLCNPDKTFMGLSASGGVDFGPKAGTGWVDTREEPSLGGTALQQLAGSAALAQQAAAAAEQGDLELARSLADQSARAMTGDFDLSAHPGLGRIPEVPPPQRVTQAELQNELVTQNSRAIAELSQAAAAPGPGSDNRRTQAEAQIHQIQGLLAAGPVEPAQARQWVKLLRNGDWGSLPVPAPRSAAVVVAPAPTPQPPVPPILDPVERARIRDEITQLRSELCRIQGHLRRFNATIQMDEDQRAQWVKITNDAYESALDRAKEKLADFTIDFPEDKLNDRLETITDPAERAKVERALRMVQHLKESYKLKDFASWAKQENYGRQEVLEGIGLITDLLGVEDKLKDYLGKRWGLGRVIAFQEAASDLVVSAYDVTAEVLAWRRLNQLNQNSDDFLKAVAKSGVRVREVVAGIHEREVRLGLPPGETKDLCP